MRRAVGPPRAGTVGPMTRPSPITPAFAALVCFALAGGCRSGMSGGEELLSIEGAPAIELVRIDGSGGGFRIGRTEVTQAQFAAFVRATGYDGGDHPSTKPSEPFLAGWRGSTPPAGREYHPVCNVNVHHARAFCAWLARASGRIVRLPTDAEWELAASGDERRKFPWGCAWDPTRCNWGDALGHDRFGFADGFEEAAPVGSFPAGTTPEGVLDLAGNIWEWTAEEHLRGGPWCLGPEAQQCDQVASEDPGRADDKFGFRVVVEDAGTRPVRRGIGTR